MDKKSHVSCMLSSDTYKLLGDYAKKHHLSVRAMHDIVIKESVKRDVYLLSILPRESDKTDRVDDIDRRLKKLENDQGPREPGEPEHCYSGMVGDYHQQYLKDITPVFASGETGMSQESPEIDLDLLLSDEDSE